jgi:uncharacterized protein Yka (UPF0111/DUF47 family)
MNINIKGVEVSLKEIEEYIIVVNRNTLPHIYTFTSSTVEALVNKIKDQEELIDKLRNKATDKLYSYTVNVSHGE